MLAAVICPRLEIGGLANVVLPDVDSLDLECGFTLHVRERIDLFRFRFESLIELIVDNLGSSSENNDLLGTEEVEDMGDKVMSAWSMITLCAETREALIALGCSSDLFSDSLESDSEECGDLESDSEEYDAWRMII